MSDAGSHADGLASPTAACIAAALERRAAAVQGPLAERLRARAAAWQDTRPTACGSPVGGDAAPEDGSSPGLQALRGLVERLGREARPVAPAAASPAPQAPAPAAAGLKAVDAHRATWSRLRTQQRLHQARVAVPAQAGPLHTAQLVYRTLSQLQALSPAYLDAIVAQVDTLMAIEQRVDAFATPAVRGDRKKATRRTPA